MMVTAIFILLAAVRDWNRAGFTRVRAPEYRRGGLRGSGERPSRVLRLARQVSATSTTYAGQHWTLELRTELIDVTSNQPTPDPAWVYVDGAGHEHRYACGAWPSLVWLIDQISWCGWCGEDHDIGHWECAACGEGIEPGMRAPGTPQFIPGRVSAELVIVTPDARREWAVFSSAELEALKAAVAEHGQTPGWSPPPPEREPDNYESFRL